jgi:hypothetical protein
MPRQAAPCDRTANATRGLAVTDAKGLAEQASLAGRLIRAKSPMASELYAVAFDDDELAFRLLLRP